MLLVLCAGVSGALAETNELPAYVYPEPENNPVVAAVANYMVNNDFGYDTEDGGVLIPAPVIIKTVPEEPGEDADEVTVYGNFWIFAYKLNGNILECTAGGENPGVMKVEKKDGEWVVTSAEFAEYGDEGYMESISRFADGDSELEKEYYTAADATDGYLPQFQRSFIIGYVISNGLEGKITAFRDYGQDPVDITN